MPLKAKRPLGSCLQSASLGRGAIVLVAAAIIATGMSVGGYAVSNGLSKRSTVIANGGRGPALVLRNRPAFPPLTVSSSRKVARLNADRVDGQDAKQLEPDTLVTSIGTTSGPVPEAQLIRLPPGTYEATLHTSLNSDADPGETRCYLYPDTAFTSHHSYASVLGTAAPSETFMVISLSGLITVHRYDAGVVAWCDVPGPGWQLLTPIQVAFRRIRTAPGPRATAAPPVMRASRPAAHR